MNFLTKYFLAVLMLTLLCSSLQSQSLGQDSEGFSTIISPSFNISLDAKNNVANLSIYQELKKKGLLDDLESEGKVFERYDWKIQKKEAIKKDLRELYKGHQDTYNDDKKSRSWMLGLDITGTSENGVAALFSSENLASSSSLFGFIGYSKRWLRYKRAFIDESQNDVIDNYISTLIESESPSQIEKLIEKEVSKLQSFDFLDELDKESLLTLKNSEGYSTDAIKHHKKKLKDRFDEISTNNTVIEELQGLKNTTSQMLEFITSLELLNAKLQLLQSNPNDPLLKKERDSIITILKTVIDNEDFTKIYNQKGAFRKLYLKLERTHNKISLESLKAKLSLPTGTILDKKGWTDYYQKVSEEKARLTFLSHIVADGNENPYLDLIALYERLNNKITEKKEKRSITKRYISEGIIYFRGGATGSKFRLDAENGAITTKERFPEINFQSYKFELGYTYFFKERNYLGFSTGISYTHNLSGLDESTFALQKVDTTITEGSFASSEEVKAFSGPYDKFMRYDINLDYVRLFKLKETQDGDKNSHLFLSFNPYLRHRIYKDALILKNNTVFGIGAHAFNSKDNKLMGGAYVQTEDLFGVHHDNEDVLQKGITFGLIVKYNFDGLKPPKE